MKFARALKVAISRTAANIVLAIAKLFMSRNIMKTVLLAACLLLIADNVVRAASSEEGSDDGGYKEVMDIVRECGKEAGISEDEINNAEKLEDLDKEKAPCFYACILKKMEIMKDGKIQDDKVKEHVDKAKARMENDNAAEELQGIVDECVAEYKDEEDECTLAFNIITCVVESVKE